MAKSKTKPPEGELAIIEKPEPIKPVIRKADPADRCGKCRRRLEGKFKKCPSCGEPAI